MSELVKQKTDFEISVDTKVLMERLKKATTGETIAYSELGKLIHCDVQGKGRGYLQTARDRLLKDERMVFEVVRNEGLRRATDTAIVQSIDQTMQRVRNAARRGARTIACADYDNLNQEEKHKFNFGLSMTGALMHFTKSSSQKAIEAGVTATSARLPVGKTLELFRSQPKEEIAQP